MLELAYIQQNREEVIARLSKRNLPALEEKIDQIIELDNQRRDAQQALEATQAELNQVSRKIGKLMRQGNKDAADEAKKNTGQLKNKAKAQQQSLDDAQQALRSALVELPNLPHESVPSGSSPEDNEVVFQVDSLPGLYNQAKPHWELAQTYDMIDFELGNKITGAGFPVYKKAGARMQRALINFFLDEAVKAGYEEVQPPVVINEASGYGTGQLPDKEGMMYRLTDENYYLIPTAEVPITNFYRDVILDPAQLPVKHVGYTPCFRREAGSWGAHVRGLNRLHQFDKVELVQITRPESSYTVLEEMVAHVRRLLELLELPYRLLRLCGGDMGFTSALTYDLEVYSAAQQQWLEVSSVSNFETFQANRLKLRMKENKKTRLLHTLNGSALALPRILAALLENNQSASGIAVPSALQPYTGFDKIVKN